LQDLRWPRNNGHLNLIPFLDKQHDITDGMPGLIVSGLYAYETFI